MSDRAGLFTDTDQQDVDLSKFTAKQKARVIQKDTIKKITEENNFKSREANENAPVAQARVLRKKVQRPEPLSSRIQSYHHSLFYEIVNETGKLNAEIMELAIEALADKMGIKS